MPFIARCVPLSLRMKSCYHFYLVLQIQSTKPASVLTLCILGAINTTYGITCLPMRNILISRLSVRRNRMEACQKSTSPITGLTRRKFCYFPRIIDAWPIVHTFTLTNILTYVRTYTHICVGIERQEVNPSAFLRVGQRARVQHALSFRWIVASYPDLHRWVYVQKTTELHCRALGKCCCFQ